jgi:hypothetical protein
MSIERSHPQKEDRYKERLSMMLARMNKWTKKQRDTPRVLQVEYRKHMKQPLSEMSYTHRDFFGFVTLLSVGSPKASSNKEYYNYVKRIHLTCQCPLAPNCLRNSTLAEISKMTLEEESPCDPKGTQEADVVVGWKLLTLEEMYS